MLYYYGGESMDNKKYFPILTGITYATIFGLSFMFTKIALDSMKPMELLAVRFLIAAMCMALLRVSKVIKINLKGKPTKELMMVAIFQPVLYFIFETIGINMTSASESGLMTSLSPIIVSFLSVVFLKEKLKIKQWGFIILSVSGVVLINLMKGMKAPSNYLGLLFLFLTVLSAGLYNIIAKKATEKYSPIEVTYAMMWVGAIAFNGINFMTNVLNKNTSQYFEFLFSYKSILPLLYLGILSSVVAFFLANYTISSLPLSQAAIFGNVITVVSILAGVIILKESFHWYDLIGAIMIILGVWGTVRFGSQEEDFINESIGDLSA